MVDIRYGQLQAVSVMVRAHDVVRLGGEDVDTGNEAEHALHPGYLAVEEAPDAVEFRVLDGGRLREHFRAQGNAGVVVEAADLGDGVGVGYAVADVQAGHGVLFGERLHDDQVLVFLHERGEALAAKR